MDLKGLNTFIQVAELGSFTRTAQKLGYAQPTISVQIRQLEEELGTKLFDRIGHTVRLTERGRDLLGYAQQICHLHQEMLLDREKDLRGSVRIGLADSLCAALIRRDFLQFHSTHPHLSLHITTAGTHDLFRLLDHNEVDLVCTLDEPIHNMNYVIADETQLGVHFIVAASHPLAACRQLPIEALRKYPFLSTEAGMSYRRLLDEWLAHEAVELKPVLEIGSTKLLCEFVEQGIGIAFLPDFTTQEAVDRGAVVRLELEGFMPSLWKQLIHRRDKWISPQIQAVFECLSQIRLR